jgi:hypothetical protein
MRVNQLHPPPHISGEERGREGIYRTHWQFLCRLGSGSVPRCSLNGLWNFCKLGCATKIKKKTAVIYKCGDGIAVRIDGPFLVKFEKAMHIRMAQIAFFALCIRAHYVLGAACCILSWT